MSGCQRSIKSEPDPTIHQRWTWSQDDWHRYDEIFSWFHRSRDPVISQPDSAHLFRMKWKIMMVSLDMTPPPHFFKTAHQENATQADKVSLNDSSLFSRQCNSSRLIPKSDASAFCHLFLPSQHGVKLHHLSVGCPSVCKTPPCQPFKIHLFVCAI